MAKRGIQMGIDVESANKLKNPPAESLPSQEFQWTAENAHQFPGANHASLFANRFQIFINNGMARLAFGESLFGEEMKVFSVVSMSQSDAKELSRVLGELITQIEAPQEATPHGEPNKR